ncbi:DUF1127 domain-containing protein [Bradyrhizobium lablabi]|uniref:DUF1127 domain-containing protein n=1 Tax=Bradyrhizobium lablabi TaxID=722472 RepID=UPI0020110E84|nr:DUF1127 domain-containing protein [Bradyrhizobium lablabi]
MPAILSAIVLPAFTKAPGISSRLLVAACAGIADYPCRRTAIACLHDLDDRALRDIGVARFQIEAAVYGLIALSDQADEGMMTFATATDPRARHRAPTVEAGPWS